MTGCCYTRSRATVVPALEAKGGSHMIKRLECVNITSKDPKGLAEFYRTMGAPVSVQDENYDGWHLGNEGDKSYICVWDENAWGKSTGGPLTIVFVADDLEKTYQELKGKGIAIDPPRRTDWGGQELLLDDPDGNTVMILT